MLSPLYGQLSPLRVPTKTERVISADADVVSYILAVEAADGQQLEQGVITAVESFILGCKSDSIWSAIKSSCILAGARTLSGALVPLVGTAPTNFNFVSADYDRETGLKGDGSTKYLNSGRNTNADPQNSQHISVFVNTAHLSNTVYAVYSGVGVGQAGGTSIRRGEANPQFRPRNRSSTVDILAAGSGSATGLVAMSRSSAASYVFRYSSANYNLTRTSQTPMDADIFVFASNNAGPFDRTSARLSFYSIGESLDLALLDTRVSNLMTDLAAAI